MSSPRAQFVATLTVTALAALAMQGCGGVPSATTNAATPPPVVSQQVQGRVHGGQQPVSGALIQLYAVNPTTAMGVARPLITTTTVLTDAYGYFNITHLYNCPDNAQVYIEATGGNSGAGVNPGIVLLAGLGPCSGLSSTTNIFMDEITTAATAFALAPYMADATHVGATAATMPGLVNAFNIENELVNTSTGLAPGPMLPANATAPTTALISLADAMAACVNSAVGSAPCNAFFSAATPAGGTAPTDTATALVNIARAPGNQVGAIFSLIQSDAPFQPALSTPPNDWTMPLTFSGGGLNFPAGLAVDASGNVWVANEGAFSVSEFNDLGSAVTGASGYTGGGLLAPQSIAVDLSNNVWVANTGGSSVVKLSSSGAILSGSGFTQGGIGAATGIALDKTGNAWVTNFDMDSITELDPNGNPLHGSPILETAGSAPVSVAIDPTGNVWVSNSGSDNVGEFSSVGAPASGSPFTDGSLQGGAQVATTSTGAPFVAAPGTNELSGFTSTGSPLAASPLTGAGLNTPQAIATDGADVIWVANNATAGSLSAFTAAGTALTPATGLGSLNSPAAIAIDGSGNVWTANSGSNTLTEFVGLASPVLTPMAARIQ